MDEQRNDRDQQQPAEGQRPERDDVNQTEGSKTPSGQAMPLAPERLSAGNDPTERIPAGGGDPTEQIPAGGDEPTEQIPAGGDEPTEQIPAAAATPSEPTWSADLPATEHVPYAGVGPTEQVTATAEEPTDRPARPRGPHAPTVLLGLVCLVVAALVIAYQSADVSFDWSLVGPGAIVGAGAVLVLLGLVGLLARRER